MGVFGGGGFWGMELFFFLPEEKGAGAGPFSSRFPPLSPSLFFSSFPPYPAQIPLCTVHNTPPTSSRIMRAGLTPIASAPMRAPASWILFVSLWIYARIHIRIRIRVRTRTRALPCGDGMKEKKRKRKKQRERKYGYIYKYIYPKRKQDPQAKEAALAAGSGKRLPPVYRFARVPSRGARQATPVPRTLRGG